MLSATDLYYPMVNDSYGVPYFSRLLKNVEGNGKVFRFGADYFVLDEGGKKNAEYGHLFNRKSNKSGQIVFDSKNPKNNFEDRNQIPTENQDYFLVKDYDVLKDLSPKYYFDEGRKADASVMRKELNTKTSRLNSPN